MPVEKWSDSTALVHVGDDPQFSQDMEGAMRTGPPPCNTVLDFAGVHFVNSSNIAQLLRLRRHLITHDAKLVLCNVSNAVWGMLMVTGLDKIFEFSENVATALTTLQMAEARKPAKPPGNR